MACRNAEGHVKPARNRAAMLRPLQPTSRPAQGSRRHREAEGLDGEHEAARTVTGGNTMATTEIHGESLGRVRQAHSVL
jgi:hypothetical protein